MPKIKIGAKTIQSFIPIALTAAAVLVSPFHVQAKPVTEADIQKMVLSSPRLTDYQGQVPCAVWRLTKNYDLTSESKSVMDGTLVALCAPNANVSWISHELYAPSGGEVVIEQLSFYDPATGREVAKMVDPNSPQTSTGRIEAKMPTSASGAYVVAMSWKKESWHLFQGDAMWTGGDYPVWEFEVTVRIPIKKKLFYESSSGQEPAIYEDKDQNEKRYEWVAYKQNPVQKGIYMLWNSRPYLGFSFKKGTEVQKTQMKSLESAEWPMLTADFWNQRSGLTLDAARKGIESFWSQYVYSDVPPGAARTNLGADKQGPWTPTEAAHVLAKRLHSSMGQPVEVWFESLTETSKSGPSLAAMHSPVFYFPRESAWHVPGFGADQDKIPLKLRGRYIYRIKPNGELAIKKMKVQPPSANKLNIKWDLNLSEDSTIVGTLDVEAIGEWRAMVEAVGLDRLTGMLYGLQDWAAQNWRKELKITKANNAIRLVIPIYAKAGVANANRTEMLAKIPSFYPAPLIPLQQSDNITSLRCPLMISQKYEVKMPGSGYELLTTLGTRHGESASVRFDSEYALENKKTLLKGFEELVIRDVRIPATELSVFRQCLGTFGVWRGNTIAMRRK